MQDGRISQSGRVFFAVRMGHPVQACLIHIRKSVKGRGVVLRILGVSGVPERHHHDRVGVLGVEEVEGVPVRAVVVQHRAQIVPVTRVEISVHPSSPTG